MGKTVFPGMIRKQNSQNAYIYWMELRAGSINSVEIYWETSLSQ
jgi:hypothetical protein